VKVMNFSWETLREETNGADGHGCKDNTTVDTTEIMFEGTKWVKAPQDCVQ
jgi:hypothetical protein